MGAVEADYRAAVLLSEVPKTVPLAVLSDTIRPSQFSGIYGAALMALRTEIAGMPLPAGPIHPQMMSLPSEPGQDGIATASPR